MKKNILLTLEFEFEVEDDGSPEFKEWIGKLEGYGDDYFVDDFLEGMENHGVTGTVECIYTNTL